MRLRVGITLALLSVFLAPISMPAAQAAMSYPSAPQSVTQTAIAGGIRVTWSQPADITGGLSTYQIEYSTTGTSGTWTTAGSVAAGIYTYDILGLAANPTYVRVMSKNSSGNGMYGYPWSMIYETTNMLRDSGNTSWTYTSGYGIGASDAAGAANTAGKTFTRVRYQLAVSENTSSTAGSNINALNASADFYKWTAGTNTTAATVNPTLSNLQLPVYVASGTGIMVQANVDDLNIYSNSANVNNKNTSHGRLEIWPWDYGTTASGLTNYATPSASLYDFDDTANAPGVNSVYGSFQVHNIDDGQTIFAWNRHSNGGSADIGFGNNPVGHPDWTFCSNNNSSAGYCQDYSNFRFQTYVNFAITPLADSTPPTVSRIDSRFYVKNADTITVRSNEVGTVYLVSQAVTVTNLASITAASTNTKISATVSSVNTDTTMTIGYQSNGLYNLYASDSMGNLSTAVLATIRIDNTAPTVSSITVNSAGTAILLTASETITNSSQILSYYTVSDSGSALSVTSTSFSGSVATLTLSRAIPAGATVYFQYNIGAGVASGRWVDQAGNEMATIYTQAITNNSAVPISVSLTVPDPISKGASTTVSVSVSVAGKVSFTMSGKRIAGCLNKVASGVTPITVTCTFKPALTARQTIAATLVPTLNSYPTTTAKVDRFILKRTTLR